MEVKNKSNVLSHTRHKNHIMNKRKIELGSKGMIIEVWRKICLSFHLAKFNFKLRNEGTFVGIFWYLLEPAFFFIVMFAINQSVLTSHIYKYPMYLFIGLIMFNFFSGTINAAINAIPANAGIIKSMNISVESIIFSKLIQFSISHAIEILIFIIFFVKDLWSALLIGLYILVPFLLFAIFVFGISLMLATSRVIIKDIFQVWSVISRLLLFASPIFYKATPGSIAYLINACNPLTYYLELGRQALMSGDIFGMLILQTAIMSIFSLAMGWYIFSKNRKKFAENI